MPRKTRPRVRGGRNAWQLNGEALDAIDEVRQIPDELGLNFDEEHKDQLEQSARTFWKKKFRLQDMPKAKEIEAALREIAHVSSELWSLLDNIDVVSRQLMELKFKEIQAALEPIMLIKKRSLRALSTYKASENQNTGGRPAAVARGLFIGDLIWVYESSGAGKATFTFSPYTDPPSYYGQFFEFVKACLRKMGEPPESDAALAKAIHMAKKNTNS